MTCDKECLQLGISSSSSVSTNTNISSVQNGNMFSVRISTAMETIGSNRNLILCSFLRLGQQRKKEEKAALKAICHI